MHHFPNFYLLNTDSLQGLQKVGFTPSYPLPSPQQFKIGTIRKPPMPQPEQAWIPNTGWKETAPFQSMSSATWATKAVVTCHQPGVVLRRLLHFQEVNSDNTERANMEANPGDLTSRKENGKSLKAVEARKVPLFTT